MINPTVETDLVGELCEVFQWDWSEGKRHTFVKSRGRIRAVTLTTDGYSLALWLELEDEECVWKTSTGGELHDIICVFVNHSSESSLRLLKGGQKP